MSINSSETARSCPFGFFGDEFSFTFLSEAPVDISLLFLFFEDLGTGSGLEA